MSDNGKAPGGEPGDNPINATTPTADIYSTPTEHQPDGGSGEVPDFFKLLEEAGLTSRKEHPMIRRLRERGHLPDAPPPRPRPIRRPRMGSSDAERERVWRYIEGIARSLAATPEGQRNTRMWGGLKDAYRLAMGANIALDQVTDLIYQSAVTNGLVADDGEASVIASIRSAHNAAEREGPDYLEDRPMVAAPSGAPPAYTISPDGYAEPSADDDDTDDPPLFADIAALLSGGLPEPPKPSVLHRSDGTAIFYRGKRNELYGDPEAGKTMLALAGAAEELGTDDGRVVFIDLDGNDAAESVQRLLTLGAPREALADQDRFRYCQPADHEEVVRVVAACAGWATFAIIDCVGELLPLFGGDSNSADDYTRIMRVVAAPLEKGGAGVLLLDHPAKGQDSRNYGAGGTMAKRRAVTGVSINLVSKQPFAPGQGGMAELWINKDRPGGLAMHCPRPTGGSRRRFAGTFKLDPAGPTGRAEWQVTTDRVTADAALALDPVIERHFAAAVELGGPFTVYELARRFNRLPGGTPPTDAQKKATARAIGRLEKQGRLAPVTGSSPRRWTVAE